MRKNDEVISDTIAYIESHLDEAIRLEQIAKGIGYSKYHLNRLFTEGTGKTIHKYIQERRLSESAKELVSRETTIAQIAQNAGYSSQQSYTLAFRQFFGDTPNQYRLRRVQHLKMGRKRFDNGSKLTSSIRIEVMAA